MQVFSGRVWRVWLLFLTMVGVAFSSQIQFAINYTDAAGSGFYDASLGLARRGAFEYACDIWSGYLGASYVGETIDVSASFEALGGDATSATLGSAGPNGFMAYNFGVGPSDYLWMNAANANHYSGSDQSVGSPEIVAQFNSAVDDDTILGTRGFYYGLDGNSGSDIDFVSVLLHEIGHGLGFTSLVDSSSGAYFTLNSLIPNTPSLYDYFLVQDNGDSSYTRLVDMADADRLTALTSDELYWSGSEGAVANGDELIKMYAPETWQQGSSISHLDETSYADALMSPMYSGVSHSPDALTLGALADLGWTVIPEPSSLVLVVLLGSTILGIRRFFAM